MAQERSGAATVIAQEGDRLQVEHRGEKVTAPMRGFPTGFQLKPGSRVILADEPGGVVARPLVRAFTSRLDAGAVERRGTIEVEGKRLEMQPSTLLESIRRPDAKGTPPEFEVWVAEPGEGQPASQVVAVRRVQ